MDYVVVIKISAATMEDSIKVRPPVKIKELQSKPIVPFQSTKLKDMKSSNQIDN